MPHILSPVRIHAAALYYFDAVRRAGSVRAAARQLNVASSAVNRQILKLERELGTPVFEACDLFLFENGVSKQRVEVATAIDTSFWDKVPQAYKVVGQN